MRIHLARILALLVACFALSGCWVLDELDSGREEMEKRRLARTGGAVAHEVAAPAAEPSGGVGAAADAVKQRAAEFWKSARSLAPGSQSDAVVRCVVHGQESYMSPGDCRGRNGVVLQ